MLRFLVRGSDDGVRVWTSSPHWLCYTLQCTAKEGITRYAAANGTIEQGMA